MKKTIFIIAFILGAVLSAWVCSKTSEKWGFPYNAETVHDTIHIQDTIMRVDTMYTQHAVYDLSLDSVKVDTISTVVNGHVVSSRCRITIK